MMKNILTIASLIALWGFTAEAQQAHCGFDEHLAKMLDEDPSGIQTILDLQARAQEITHQRLEGNAERGGGPRIIPTVFHVIHQGGSENISYEQIEDQIRVLNEDFRRLNTDAANTRSQFVPVAADANVEFRLAKLDPQGNCTDGVVRVWSPLTYNASDENGVKSLSYWNSTKYFNVWVVATIDNDGEQGVTLGYAQFPGFGGASTDGVVVRSDYVGSIGTAANTGNKGRVLTHEVGHWLGLFHTFQGGCNGGFFGEGVDDTPPTAEANFGCSLNLNSCSNDNPDQLDMVENYMDYSNGSCQNIYTLGQKDRFDAVLSSDRSQIHSASNLNSTGVLLGETPCAPVAQFYAEQTIVCVGQDVTFTDDSYNGDVSTYDWTLTGATPNQSGNANPTVVYDAPGTYTVTLNVSNAQGNDSYSQTNYVTVIPAAAEVNSWFSFEGFEETEEDYIVISDGLGNTWQETNTAFTGSTGIYLKNYSGNPLGSVDEFQLPSVNLSLMNDPDLYFRVAYKQRSGGKSDNLRVYASRDCGDSWSLRFNKSGSALATVSGTQGSPFTPGSESDWEMISVNLGAFADDEHVLVKFRGTSDEGNNIYLDDIQISGPLGVEDHHTGFEFTVGPNPLDEVGQVTLDVTATDDYLITVMDVTGKRVMSIHQGRLSFGKHEFVIDRQMLPSAGVYLIQVEAQSGRSVKKLVVR